MSSGSSVKALLAGFAAGRVSADRAAAGVAAAYYAGNGAVRTALAPLVEVIERAAPGVIELARTTEGAGFALRAGERPFPRDAEVLLRQATAAVLASPWGSAPDTAPDAGFLARLVARVRQLFSAGS